MKNPSTFPWNRRARRGRAGMAALLVASGLATVLVGPGPVAQAAEAVETTALVSDGTDGEAMNTVHALSDDGDWVAYEQIDQGSGRVIVLVKNRRTGEGRHISLNSEGVPADGNSQFPVISGTGRFVAFMSADSGNLGAPPSSFSQVFVHDRDFDEDGVFDEAPEGALNTAVVSLDSGGNPGADDTFPGDISDDGRYVVLESRATLVAGLNHGEDTFLRDRDTDEDGIFDEPGQTSLERLNVSSDEVQGDGPSFQVSLTPDGRYAAFTSGATNLVPGDDNGVNDVFVRDIVAGTTTRISVATDGADLGDEADSSSISATGRHVSFAVGPQVVVRDRDTDADGIFDEAGAVATVPVSVDGNGNFPATGESRRATISGDGRFIAFESESNDLAPNDTNTCPPDACRDILLRDRDPLGDGLDGPDASTSLVSLTADGDQLSGHSFVPAISADGTAVAFHAEVDGVVGDDADGLSDVFVRSRPESVFGIMDAGAVLSTGDPASPSDPFEATARTPVGGNLGITEVLSGAAPAGFSLLRTSFNVISEIQTVADPLRLTFRIDASALPPGTTASTLTVFRGGVAVPGCSGGAPGAATPNPCVDERVTRADGDAQITAFTTTGGTWSFGTAVATFLASQGPGVTNGTPADASPRAVSDDGRYVAFGAIDPSDLRSVFVRDLQTGDVRKVSVSSAGLPATEESSGAVISGTGRFVAFSVAAGNFDGIVTTATNVYVHDRDADVDGVFDEAGPGTTKTVVVSVDSAGNPAGNATFLGDISDDGRRVVMMSSALLAPGDPQQDVYVHDRDADADGVFDEGDPGAISTDRVNVSSSEEQGDGAGTSPSITPDGRYVVFLSEATNLTADDNSTRGAYVRDLVAGTTAKANLVADGSSAHADETPPSISADGRHVSFMVGGSIVVRDRDADGDGVFDEPGAVSLVAIEVAADGSPPNGLGADPVLSGDGRFVAFTSRASNLVAGDVRRCKVTGHPFEPDNVRNCADVFVRDRDPAGNGLDGPDATTSMVSLTETGTQVHADSRTPAIDFDGTTVVFQTPDRATEDDLDNDRVDVFVRTRTLDVPAAPIDQAEEVLPPGGGTVSTGDATAADPVGAAVTSPNGGSVVITESAGGTPPDGFTFLGYQIDISARPATPTDPLTLQFRFHSSIIPEPVNPAVALEDTVVITRNGTEVDPCAVANGTATPDPCVSNRQFLPASGEVVITVLTSAASSWSGLVRNVTEPDGQLTGASSTAYGQTAAFTARVCPDTDLADPPVPTGSVEFGDGTTTLHTGTLAQDGASRCAQTQMSVSSLIPGTHSITASYLGDANYQAGEVGMASHAVTCSPISGLRLSVNVTSGAKCLQGATVLGSVTVSKGASLFVSKSTVIGFLTAAGAGTVGVCDSRVTGLATITDSSGFVLVGGAPGCAGNREIGALTLRQNRGGVRFGGNRIFGLATLTGNRAPSGGIDPAGGAAATVVSRNTVLGGLACTKNVPAATNAGQHNSVIGLRIGECASPGF